MNTDKAIDQQEVPQAAKGDVMREELKRCPFCGEEATLTNIPPHKHVLAIHIPAHMGCFCIECIPCGVGIIREKRLEAIKAWNTRAKHYSSPVACGWQPSERDLANKIRNIVNDESNYARSFSEYIVDDEKMTAAIVGLFKEITPHLPAMDEELQKAIKLIFPLKIVSGDAAMHMQPHSKMCVNSTAAWAVSAETLRSRHQVQKAADIINAYILRPTPPLVDIAQGAAALKEIQAQQASDANYLHMGAWNCEEQAKHLAKAWGLTEGGKAPDLAALEADEFDRAARLYHLCVDILQIYRERDTNTKRPRFTQLTKEEQKPIIEAIRQHAAHTPVKGE